LSERTRVPPSAPTYAVHVGAQRLGHSKVEMTLNIYAHVLPDMQQEAATKLGALLHG
jgi:integrase